MLLSSGEPMVSARRHAAVRWAKVIKDNNIKSGD